ncbi:MAG: BamA/TamA family outer membrane protein [Bacteroidia bacterium]|nr:BamA/TamA family outer membrane protein [Bacteroidia bacterium]
MIFPASIIRFLILIACLNGGWQLYGQTWEIDGMAEKSAGSIPRRTWMAATDSMEILRLTNRWLEEVAREGYLEAGIDSFLWRGGNWHLHLHQGPLYLLDSLKIEGLPPVWLQGSRLDKYQRKTRPLKWEEVDVRLLSSLQLAQNEGFPFASFKQTDLTYVPGTEVLHVSTSYLFSPGPEIRIDSIQFVGKKKEPDAFVWGIIRLQPGDLFNQSQIDAIPTLLNNTVYYQDVEQATIGYTDNGKAIVTVNLKQKKSNRFDILAGLLPADPASDQRFQFTVTADVTLVSPFGKGEIIGLEFRKLPGTSQLVDVFTRLPYLFRTPLQAEGRLKLQKQEELFQNLTYEAGLFYHFTPYLQAKFSLHGLDTRLLETALRDTATLTPAQLDGTRRLLGIGFLYEQLDYRNNPRKGWDSHLSLGIGRREIKENVLLRALKPEWYSSVPPSQGIREVELKVKTYFPIGLRQVIHLGQHTYWLGMDNYLRNDQRQVGGVYSLRGFNENQYFADLLVQLTAEYRLQLERDSYIFGFVDLAYLEDNVDLINRRAIGTGIGMQYGTQVGILSIVYGIGVSDDQSFQPSRGRIHLGLINEF